MKLDRITVTKILRYFRANGCRKSRNGFRKQFVYFKQQKDCNRCRIKISRSRRRPSLGYHLYLPFLIKQMKPSHGPINSQLSYLRMALEMYDFTEIVNKLQFEARSSIANWEIYFKFSLKLLIQFWKYFHSMVLGSVSRF